MAPLPATRIWIRNGSTALERPNHFTKTINDQGASKKGIFHFKYLATILEFWNVDAEVKVSMLCGREPSLACQAARLACNASAVAEAL